MSLASVEPAPTADAFSRIPMLPGMSVREYLAMCEEHHPELYRRLSPFRVPVEHTARLYEGIAELSTHFESKLEKGRGDSYRQAQNRQFLIRSVGFLHLFDLAVPRPSPQLAVLDALGGNGTLTRIVRACRPPQELPFIVTSDVSGRMIESALAQDLPAIRQPLQDLIWFEDGTFDTVIVAYGTHHVPPAERARAVGEAYRVLKPGGRVLLQDFEIGNPTTRWYEDALDLYTSTGHKYEYFTRREFHDLLAINSFTGIEVRDVYDPLVHYAADPEAARRELLDYVFTLFALEKLAQEGGVRDEAFWDRLEAVVRESSTFDPAQLPAGSPTVREFTVARDGDRYRAEIPRVCLVATGWKPPAAASV